MAVKHHPKGRGRPNARLPLHRHAEQKARIEPHPNKERLSVATPAAAAEAVGESQAVFTPQGDPEPEVDVFVIVSTPAADGAPAELDPSAEIEPGYKEETMMDQDADYVREEMKAGAEATRKETFENTFATEVAPDAENKLETPGAGPEAAMAEFEHGKPGPMEPNPFRQLDAGLTHLHATLENHTSREAFKAIPDPMKAPIKEGLECVLNSVKGTLEELEHRSHDVHAASPLLHAMSNLVAAALRLAPGERHNAEKVRENVDVLDHLPSRAEIEAMEYRIDEIVAKVRRL
jgi:hypothetical protein